MYGIGFSELLTLTPVHRQVWIESFFFLIVWVLTSARCSSVRLSRLLSQTAQVLFVYRAPQVALKPRGEPGDLI